MKKLIIIFTLFFLLSCGEPQPGTLAYEQQHRQGEITMQKQEKSGGFDITMLKIAEWETDGGFVSHSVYKFSQESALIPRQCIVLISTYRSSFGCAMTVTDITPYFIIK